MLFGVPKSVPTGVAASLGPGVSNCLGLPLHVNKTSGVRFGCPWPRFGGVISSKIDVSMGLVGSGVCSSSEINILVILFRALSIGDTIASESSVGAGLMR